MSKCDLCGGKLPAPLTTFPRSTNVLIHVGLNHTTPLYWHKVICAKCFVKVGTLLAILQEGLDALAE